MNKGVDHVVAHGVEVLTEGIVQLEEQNEGIAPGQLAKHKDRAPIHDPCNLGEVSQVLLFHAAVPLSSGPTFKSRRGRSPTKA